MLVVYFPDSCSCFMRQLVSVPSLYGYFHCVVAVLAVYGVDCGGKSGLLSAVDSVEKVALNCAGGADVPDYHARFLVEKRGGRVPLRA